MGKISEEIKTRRSRSEIILAILSAASEKPSTKTSIVYKSGLTFNRIESYIEFLKKRNLLNYSDRLFRITARGEALLAQLKEVERMMIEA